MKCTIKKFMRVSAVALGLAWSSQVLSQTMGSSSASNVAANKAGIQFDFKYTSSDVRFNVFDDGASTRVLMPQDSLVPVITTLKPSGEILLTPKVDGMALVLDGVHSGLKLIWANGKTVVIQYQGANHSNRQGQAAAFGAVATKAQFQSMAAPTRTSSAEAPDVERELVRAGTRQVGKLEVHTELPPQPLVTTSQAQNTDAKLQEKMPPFELQPPETIRAALQRWSNQAGWTFGAEFYALPADIPVATSANLGEDFKAAVRILLDSTAMSEVPAQPCFYSNQVLRVVPKHELCSRP